MRSGKIKSRLIRIPILILFISLALVMLIPIVWILFGAFKPDNEIISYPPTFFPHEFSLKNFTKCMQRIDIIQYIKNSIIFSFGTTIPSLLVNSLAGYAFARYEFKGKNIIFVIFLATMMIPFQVIMIPEFIEIHLLGMYDNYWGLIVPKIASAYWIFMMRSAFAGLPRELEEAARIDGLNEFGIYSRIMLPLIKPALVTMIILSINGNWNDLLWPLIMTSSSKMRTLANGLAMFVGARTIEYGAAFAGAFISLIPMLILYIFGQKYFVEGQATSGLKG
ncbi:MAG: carbohydrate ABC transporter permease [Lachnospiraceae bacterium]|jgi:multiple sugar transport system permease protein|nr:carbohydrate ABC transporter permease [Lachnospiraceae bacterium]MCI8987168.1 carbohydrate ABC transporter permease [Lachnospiraceae bacterium]MCI9012369.1 carbohydrate ABC transporter permease [Lachnospiraceae bacterium]MCI9253903.1 carbohydrate ABC transporter permease [Lachnospiraceae bacterium]